MENNEVNVQKPSSFVLIMNKVNWFYGTFYSVILFCGIATLFGVFSIVQYAWMGGSINGTTIEMNVVGRQILAWFTIFLSLISIYVGFISSILVARGKASFVFWMTTMNALLVVTNGLAGLWLLNIQIIICFPLLAIRYHVWKYELYEQEKYSFKNIGWIVYVIAIGFTIAFFGIVGLWGEEIYSVSTNPEMNINLAGTVQEIGGIEVDYSDIEVHQYLWYLDALTASLGMAGNLAAVFKWRHNYLWMSIQKVPQIWLLSIGHNWVPIVQVLIWFTLDMSTILTWTAQSLDSKNKKMLEIQDSREQE